MKEHRAQHQNHACRLQYERIDHATPTITRRAPPTVTASLTNCRAPFKKLKYSIQEISECLRATAVYDSYSHNHSFWKEKREILRTTTIVSGILSAVSLFFPSAASDELLWIEIARTRDNGREFTASRNREHDKWVSFERSGILENCM